MFQMLSSSAPTPHPILTITHPPNNDACGRRLSFLLRLPPSASSRSPPSLLAPSAADALSSTPSPIMSTRCWSVTSAAADDDAAAADDDPGGAAAPASAAAAPTVTPDATADNPKDEDEEDDDDP